MFETFIQNSATMLQVTQITLVLGYIFLMKKLLSSNVVKIDPQKRIRVGTIFGRHETSTIIF